MEKDLISELAAKGYWPAVALEYFMEGKYSRVIELAQLRLKDDPDVLSGRIIYARALFHSGQFAAAEEQFYKILRLDPSNIIAIKYIGDLKFRVGDEATAFSYYEKILNARPFTGGLASRLENGKGEETRILTLAGKAEETISHPEALRKIPFKTETLGDLLYKQGHIRLAREIYQELANKSGNTRIIEKLERTMEHIKNKER
jgi:tetratricopeptide (TPR) repeat protein